MPASRYLIIAAAGLAVALGLLAFACLLEAPPPIYVGLTLAVGLVCCWGAWRGVFLVMGVERQRYQTRDLRAYTSLFGLLVILASSLWLLLYGADPVWGGPAAGGSLALLVFFAVALRRYLPLRRALKPRVWPTDAAELERALELAVAGFERAGAAHGRHAVAARALEAVVLVGQLNELMRFEQAARVLKTIDAERLTPAMRAAVQSSRATVLLFLRDRNGAWRALKEAFANATEPRVVAQLKLTDALATALDGHGAEALSRLEELGEPADAKFRRAHLLTRAHALAAEGDGAAARAVLVELRDLAQREPLGNVLERAIALGGPASALAEELKRQG